MSLVSLFVLYPWLGAFVCCVILIPIGVFVATSFRHPVRKQRRVAAVIVAILVGLPLLFFALHIFRENLFWSSWARAGEEHNQRRQRLILYHTDHRSVLEAGRQILADTNKFSRDLPVEMTNLPAVLRDLDPSSIFIYPDRDCVTVEMGGGFFHFGYDVFRDGETGSGTKELIPGLWYYSEDQKVISPE